jgi:hypothetical protein
MTGEYGDGSGESGQSAGSGGQKSPRSESLTRLTVWTPVLVIVKIIGWLSARKFESIAKRVDAGLWVVLR